MHFAIRGEIRNLDLVRTDSNYRAVSVVKVVDIVNTSSDKDVIFEYGVRIPRVPGSWKRRKWASERLA